MKRDSRLSGVLHVLLHMAEHRAPRTSEQLAKAMQTHPVVIRRILGGLRDAGFVHSEKGHGGGWTIARDLAAMPSYRVARARVLDMFPQSSHFEAITLLERA